jgi:DnaJ family protein A protein 2
LFIEKEITLVEALTGLDFVITHLDGRKIRIKNTPGEVIKPDAIKTVENVGMPLHKKTYNHGNLFIHFKIKFPATMDAKSLGLISDALGSAKGSTPKANGKKTAEESKKEDVAETCEMKAFEEMHRNTHHGGGTQGNDSEEEEDDGSHGGQKVGCQTQ